MTKSIDRALARIIHNECQIVLLAVAQKHGLILHAGKSRFDNNRQTVNFELVVRESVATTNNNNFALQCGFFGLEASDLGKTFKFKNRIYTIAGLRPAAVKFPIIATRDDGKQFKFPVEAYKRAI